MTNQPAAAAGAVQQSHQRSPSRSPRSRSWRVLVVAVLHLRRTSTPTCSGSTSSASSSVLTTQWVAQRRHVPHRVRRHGARRSGCRIEIAFRSRPVYAKLNSQLDRYQQVDRAAAPARDVRHPDRARHLRRRLDRRPAGRSVLQWLNTTPFGADRPAVRARRLVLPLRAAVLPRRPRLRLGGHARSPASRRSPPATCTAASGSAAASCASRAPRASSSPSLAALYLALQAVQHLARPVRDPHSTSGDLITGAGYTDVNAIIPGRAILAGIAALVAVLFIVTAIIGRWRLPAHRHRAAHRRRASSSAAIYPWIVQRFQVDPSARTLEAEYIQRSIDATRDAYGVADVEEMPVQRDDGCRAGRPARGRRDDGQHPHPRPRAREPTSFAQLEQFQQYYQFADAPRRRPLRDRRQDPGHRDRGPRAQPGRLRAPHDLVQQHPRLHPRLRRRRRLRQPARDRRPAGVPRVGHPDAPATSATSSRASTSARTRRATRSSAAPEDGDPARARLPVGRRRGQTANDNDTTFDGDGGPKLDNVF